MNIKESTPMNPFLSRYIEYRIKLFRKKGLYFQLFVLEKSFKICCFGKKNAQLFLWFLISNIDQGIHKVKLKVARIEIKNKKTTWVFFLHKH